MRVSFSLKAPTRPHRAPDKAPDRHPMRGAISRPPGATRARKVGRKPEPGPVGPPPQPDPRTVPVPGKIP